MDLNPSRQNVILAPNFLKKYSRKKILKRESITKFHGSETNKTVKGRIKQFSIIFFLRSFLLKTRHIYKHDKLKIIDFFIFYLMSSIFFFLIILKYQF